MKRRQFLRSASLGATGAALGGAVTLSGCSAEEPYKFWHEGNYPPVAEEITATDLPVIGAIPPELNGLYVRNGPNEHTGPSNHFFGGDGMLHGVRLEQGRALWYRNRYVDTPVLREETGGFGAPKLTDTTSAVSLIEHGGRLLSLGEFGYPYEIDPEDLSTRGVYTYDERLKTNMTAHPKIDPVTGELLFFGYNVTAPYLTYMRADASGKLVQTEDIVTRSPTMMHDFAVTENYVIFMEMPIVFSWWLAVTGDGLPFRWDDDAVCRFGVMPRTGTNADVQWFDVDPCFIFHTMNAYEDGDTVVLDAARYDSLWVKDSHDFGHPAYLTRFELDRNSGGVRQTRLDEQSMEFPQMHRGLWARPYRYGYALSSDHSLGEMSYDGATGFIKYDLQSGSSEKFMLDQAYAPNEAFFVAAGGNEDDGYLLSYIYDRNNHSSELWILDASRIQAPPLARIQLPARVPQGFHGLWVDAEKIS
jgi:carotenoid cleavage dioxygenase-like enzyme